MATDCLLDMLMSQELELKQQAAKVSCYRITMMIALKDVIRDFYNLLTLRRTVSKTSCSVGQGVIMCKSH